jgi:hypothetical protein
MTKLWACLTAFTIFAVSISAQQLTPAWVVVGEGGVATARVVVSTPGSCPTINIDGAAHPMTERNPIPNGFRPVCETTIPRSAKSASVSGKALALPKPNPSRVVVMGDTGCRIKGKRAQNCNNPDVWPFQYLANSAAGGKPDLLIHVGDYLYRESPCPDGSEAKCGNTPNGDNWDAWNIDFFTPAAELLGAAPWAFSRGNHEACYKSWRGWSYYLDPRPWTGICIEYSAPYLVKLGTFEMAMLDSSAANEDSPDAKEGSAYAVQLASLHPQNAWLVTHYPFWGFKTDPHGDPPVPLLPSLESAWDASAPKGYSLILSGHVHLFEFVSLDHDHPIQIVAGDGGTEMAVPIEMSLNGTKIRGATVIASRSKQQFGYTVLTKSGLTWKVELRNRLHQTMVTCTVPGSSAQCEGSGTD